MATQKGTTQEPF